MAGLLDGLFNSPETMGLLSAAAAMAERSGPSTRPTSFGQVMSSGLLGGLQGYQNVQDAQFKRDYQKSQMEENAMQAKLYGMKVKEAEQAQEQAKALRDAYRSFGTAASSGVPGMSGITPASPPKMGGMPAAQMGGEVFYQAASAAGLGTDHGTLNRIVSLVNQGMSPDEAAQSISGKGGDSKVSTGNSPLGTQGVGGTAPIQQLDLSSPYKRNLALAQHLESKGLYDQATKLYEMAEKHKPKVKNWQEVRQDDQVLYAPYFEDGTAGAPVPYQVAEKLHFANLGGKTVGVDAYTGKEVAGYKNTQSPDSIASNAVTMRGQNMVDSRARQSLALQQQEMLGGAKAPAGYRWNTSGGLEAIPGGPADKQQIATEGERKAATLLQRLEGSQVQMNAALKEKPSAATPGLVANGLRAVGAESVANSLATSSPRQRVEASQLDILDAALTLGTGAAYTREQLEGYRKSYFPQVGDSEATIKDKEDRLNNLVSAAKIAAGRAAPSATTNSSPSQAAQNKTLLAQLPTANKSNQGKIAIDHETGKRFKSNGLQWVEVQ